MNTALNRTTIAYLTNKSGGTLTYGAVVVLDNTNANGFTTTTTAGLSTRGIGVVFDVAGIANNATGAVAMAGWVPQINLDGAATIGQFVKSSTVAGQGTPHSSPQVEGDFAVALNSGTTPPAVLFGSANGPLGGGTGTVTHTAGALTLNQLVYGNGSADIKVVAATDGQIPIGKTSDGTAAFATLTAGNGVSVTNGGNSITLATSTAQRTRAITFAIDGGGSVLTTGIKADIYVPYACTITSVTMLADQSGSVVVDIWKDTLANYPPTVADSIVASAPPTISSATNSQDSTLTGWTTSVSAGDTMRFNINSASTITRLNLTLTVTVS